jgi:hypothetical protein
MEHSIASAIRTVGAKICRRLDVLIAAAGQPPVQDIEGTPAPRRPLAASACQKIQETSAATPRLQENQTLPDSNKRKRGRPPKKSAAATPAATATPGSSSSDNDDDEGTPDNTCFDFAEVKPFCFPFFVCY